MILSGTCSGTEQFVIITTQAYGPRLRGVLARRVTEELESFYSFVEREQGYVLLEDGAGGSCAKAADDRTDHRHAGRTRPGRRASSRRRCLGGCGSAGDDDRMTTTSRMVRLGV